MTSVSLRVQNEDVYSHTQRRQSGFKFGGCGSGSNKFRSLQTIFFRQLHKRISQKNSIFPGKFPKNVDFFRQFKTKIDFPGKNFPFTATSGQIILFLFKSHHFRTYFLHMIRYNNILRPVHDPQRPPVRPL